MSFILTKLLPALDKLVVNRLAVESMFDVEDALIIIDSNWEDVFDDEDSKESDKLLKTVEILFLIAEDKLDDIHKVPDNLFSMFVNKILKVYFLFMCHDLYLKSFVIATRHQIPKQIIISHLQAEYSKIASEKQALEAEIMKTISNLQIPISANALSLPKPIIPKLDQIRLNVLYSYYQVLLNKINKGSVPLASHSELMKLLNLIDTDIEAAFDQLDQYPWGDQNGIYRDLKLQWVDLPQGFSKSEYRSKLKIFVKSQWQ